jgi:hypothetical protein
VSLFLVIEPNINQDDCDRYGNLGVKERWWQRPTNLTANAPRTSTTVLAGVIGDDTADLAAGIPVTKYTHWTHALPSATLIPELKRALERARKDACTELNNAVRPYTSHDPPSEKQTRHGRRWADSRGLQVVHVDIASTLAEAMDTGIIRCAIQGFCSKVLPSRVLWRSVQRNVHVREEYSRIVRTYRQELHRIIRSLSALDSEARTKIAVSWGIEENEKPSPLLVQLFDASLSKHAFVSPHAPVATLLDVASRLDMLAPLLPTSGPMTYMCGIYAQTLLARFPDELWHAYTTPVPPVPVSAILAAWRRARDSQLFWAAVDILGQWLLALALIPVEHVYGLWVLALPLIHVAIIWPWIMRERKAWRRIWKVYEGGIIQGRGETWDNDLSTLSSQSKASLLNTKWDGAHNEIALDMLGHGSFPSR